MPFDQREYNHQYYKRHRDKLVARAGKRYATLRNDPAFKAAVKARREAQHYGVPASVVFRKTKGRCYFCGGAAVVVHHLDGDGRTNEQRGKKPGTDVDRLVGACRSCHLEVHRAEMLLVKKTRANGYWSRTYDCCVKCGTAERKHAGHGLCVNCAARRRRSKGTRV